MKKILPGLLLLCVALHYNAQTGPGGVGTSGNNKLWLVSNKGVSVSGTSVTAWADQSGSGNNATPAANTNRPMLVSGSVNGYPSLKFDGIDDELRVTDNAGLDLTQWHIFLAVLVNTQKDYNAWMVKGNDGSENYEVLSYADGNIHTPILYTDASRVFTNAPAGQVTTTEFNIIEYSYSSAVGRDVYKNYGSAVSDNDNKTPATNGFDLYIGNEKTTSRFVDGNIAEAILYNAPINSAQRIIVNNYLAAKYNRTLTSNDIYDEDDVGYDHDVAGIGRVDGSNTQTDSRGSGMVRILNASGMGDGEFYIWGHDNGLLGSYGITDFPAAQGVRGRLGRVWRGSETGTITNFEVRFDLTGLGPVTASDLRLLIDVNNNGSFADETVGGGGIIGSAVTLGGNVYGFTNIAGLNNNIRFTVGTMSVAATPLPIELISFDAAPEEEKVSINWSTATETNNDYFTVEKTTNFIDFETVAIINGAGTSSSVKHYATTDNHPYEGLSYYRLKQTDTNNDSKYSEYASVNFTKEEELKFKIYPNPNDGNKIELLINSPKNSEITISIYDTYGKIMYDQLLQLENNTTNFSIDLSEKLSTGMYCVKVNTAQKSYSQKLIVK